MGASENKEFIRNIFTDLSKGKVETFLDGLADDVRYTIIGTSKYSGTYKGKQELIGRLFQPLMGQLDGGITVTPNNLIGDGDYIAMESHGHAKSKNGVSYNNTYCHVFRIKDGKVQEVTEYLDTELLTRAFDA